MTGQADLLDLVEAATNRCGNRQTAMRLRWLRHLRLVARRGRATDILDRVARNVPAWDAAVIGQAIQALAETGNVFSADDVWDLGVPQPASPGHVGALFSAARKAGVIRPVGFVPSRREGRNGSIVRTWVGA